MIEPFDVRLDDAACIGSGMCRMVAPAVFVAGEAGKSTVADSMGDPLDLVIESAEMCPGGAISVTDRATGGRLDV